MNRDTVHPDQKLRPERTLTRAELTDAIQRAMAAAKNADPDEPVTREAAARMLETVLGAMMKALEDGEQVKISAFGSFVIHHKAERIGRNPKTGVEAIISSRRSLSFRASNILRDTVNGGARGLNHARKAGR